MCQHHIAIFITCELVEDVLIRVFVTPFLFCAKLFRDSKEGHNGRMVNIVGFYLVENLDGVAQRFWNVLEDIVHLLTGLEPLLLAVEHAVGVVQILACR